MDLNLKGRVTVITGPAKGMGAAITLAFARAGCRLSLIGRDVAAIELVAAEARGLGAEAVVIACDITSGSACEAAMEQTRACFGGRIDVLVNVAGGRGTFGKPGWETTEAEFDEVVHLNMGGSFNTMRACLPTMVEQRYGKIVNVGGTFGMHGRAGRAAYSASKWGLRGITKSFAAEAGPYNINVNCVAPGLVDGPRCRTEIVPEMAKRLGISEEAAIEKLVAESALQRVSTDVDVANACLFLASDVSRQITGVDLPVDGGWAML
jgi:NAD(P)-dependent dehydrogenase (short-subunit alcohol dehydrogenase family)